MSGSWVDYSVYESKRQLNCINRGVVLGSYFYYKQRNAASRSLSGMSFDFAPLIEEKATFPAADKQSMDRIRSQYPVFFDAESTSSSTLSGVFIPSAL
jgi:hypothetical protein